MTLAIQRIRAYWIDHERGMTLLALLLIAFLLSVAIGYISAKPL